MLELKNNAIKAVRKLHSCGWCGEAINIGEPAQYRFYVFDGPTSDWMHPECYIVMESCDDTTEHGWMPGVFQRGYKA